MAQKMFNPSWTKLAEYGLMPTEAKERYIKKASLVDWDRTECRQSCSSSSDPIRSGHFHLMGWLEEEYVLLFHPAEHRQSSFTTTAVGMTMNRIRSHNQSSSKYGIHAEELD